MPIFIALFNVLGRAVELREEGFFGWITDLSYPDVVLPALQVPYVFPEGLTILPFFMAGTMWIQMKMTIKDPNQKFMVWMMPVMMFFFSCSFPSGLVVYWTVSNVFTIGQTAWINSKKKTPPISANEDAVEASFKQAKPRASGNNSGKSGSSKPGSSRK
jgi:YidC/Oxa1 family membrane protein insertase